MPKKSITVVGAGVLGLWQALRLAQAGNKVRVIEASAQPFIASASRWAGAMLAPECEAESAPAIVRDLGRNSLQAWREVVPGIEQNGTLVVAPARDQSEITRFARVTEGHEKLSSEAIAKLEPDLAGRFDAALFYKSEAHMDASAALTALLDAVKRIGVEVLFGERWDGRASDGITIDCRGYAARADLKDLRGVRGERLVVKTNDIKLSRPVRLIHPRQPIYVVPQCDGRFVIGATVIEREDDGPMTVRSALELLGSAYALHPAFGEAAILDMGAGVRPAFPDNVPRAIVRDGGRLIHVNGAYRHGFLLAPVLANAVVGLVERGEGHKLVAGGV